MKWNLEETYWRSSLKFLDVHGYVCAQKNRPVLDDKTPASLVVVNTALVVPWEKELAKSVLSVLVVSSEEGLDHIAETADNVNVVLCGHTFYQELVEACPRVWKRVIFDDPVASLIPKMHPIDAGFVWFVTSTSSFGDAFRRKRSRPHFIYHIFSRMPGDIFQSLVVKNDDSYVYGSFPLAPPVTTVYDCASDETEEKDTVAYIWERVEELGGTVRSQLVTSEAGAICPICLASPLKNEILVNCCQQFIGGACLLEWLAQSFTCPLCREILSGPDLVCSGPSSPVHRGPLSRNNTVVTLLKKFPVGVFLVYVGPRQSVPAIRTALHKSYYRAEALTGASSDQQILKQFREGEFRILIFSENQCGIGIGLQAVTDLVLFHDVPPNTETHLVSRANRIGRTVGVPLRLHYLK